MSSIKYCCLGAVRKEYFRHALTSAKRKKTEVLIQLGSENTKHLRRNTPLGHYSYTGCGPVGLGQYDSLGEYCGPHTASSVFFFILVRNTRKLYVFCSLVYLQNEIIEHCWEMLTNARCF